jgi:fucose permease
VLISPVIAALPAEDPDREMSKLHSIYAWGVVFVIVVSTLFLLFVGDASWQWLALGFALIPVLSAFLFFGSEIPAMETPKQTSDVGRLLKNKGIWLSVFAIFLGGAAECTMAQWSSGYLEQALGIPKVWGDLFGVALFSVMLGLGRSLYAKMGRNIEKALTFGAIGATLCYFTVAVFNVAWLGLIACAFTGFCVSMLWPGNLVVASDKFPQAGVFIYAMMAAGGDLGASVGPQLVGVIADAVIANPASLSLVQSLSLTPEQLGMKLGMLLGMIFPLIGIFVYAHIWKNAKKKSDS